MQLDEQLTRLARLQPGPTPVVSVYLNIRWADEHQRDRVRVFLKNELKRARANGAARASAEDLDWIEAEGKSLVEQVKYEEANGVALFACGRVGLREVLPVRRSFPDTFVIDDTPFLRPLAAAIEHVLTALVVFIDGTSVRLIPVGTAGVADEVVLEDDVEGRHRSGGWAALAQSRYQRHIEKHREQHFEAVAAAVAGLSAKEGADRIVIAGEPRMIAALQTHLPKPVADRVAGSVSGTRYEPASAIVARANDLLAATEAKEMNRAVDVALTEAAKGGSAVSGIAGAVDGVNRGAIRHLYLLESFEEPGRVCVECGALHQRSDAPCRFCGKATRPTELGEAMVDRVIAAGGTVTMIGGHARLAETGGVVAVLRYAA